MLLFLLGLACGVCATVGWAACASAGRADDDVHPDHVLHDVPRRVRRARPTLETNAWN